MTVFEICSIRPSAAALGALGFAAFGFAAAPAHAVADLIIVQQDSQIIFESCDRDKPLATGTIAIKNIGDTRAKLKLGVLTRYSRSLLAVYVPEHLDMIDKGYERTALDSRDQESIKVSIGKNIIKRGRLGGSLAPHELAQDELAASQKVNVAIGDAVDDALLDLSALNREETKDLQRALRQAGYYRGPLDGVIGSGGRSAINRFQRSIGAPETGQLTLGETEELSRQTGVSLILVTSETIPVSSGSQAVNVPATIQPNRPVSNGARTEVTLYAVVDPYNLVKESDETNNLVKFTGVINCQ